MKILFFPAFENQHLLSQYLHRAAWYLYPLRSHINSIVFFKTEDIEVNLKNINPAELLDKTANHNLKKFNEIKIKNLTKGRGIDDIDTEEFDYIFVSSESHREQLIKKKKKNNENFEIVRVDHKNVQYADSFFLRFAEKIKGLHEKYKLISKNKIDQFLPGLLSHRIYLFGTGPNFENIKNHDFSDGLVIACNSMVINEEIINNLNPKLFVIADPIFHAGPSSYASSFRTAFLKVLQKKNFPIIVPLRDYHIYSSCFPQDIVERIIPISFYPPTESNNKPVTNLFKNNHVTTTSNILTLFQLPLASTLGNEIYISGCDGRPITQNNYFWSHNKSVQINDKMSEIQKAHPAFFNISYDDYYLTHIETLEKWITEIEQQGKKVYNLTPSYIPALQNRTIDLLLPELRSAVTNDLSIIIPLYNADAYLEEAIDSVVNDCKGYINYEIIIVDDFSEDSSLKLAKSLSEKNNNIKVYQNFRKKGVSGARNTGIALSNSKAICFLDSDDFIYPGSIRTRYNEISNHPEIDAVHSTLLFVDKYGNYLDVEVGIKRDISFKDCSGNPASFNTLMFNNQSIKEIIFKEDLTNGEDWLALAVFLRKGFTSKYVKDGKASYRVHEKSTVISDFTRHEDGLLPVIKWLHKDFRKANKYKHSAPLPNSSEDSIVNKRQLNKLIMLTLSGNLSSDIGNKISNEDIKAIFEKNINYSMALKVPFVRAFQTSIKRPSSIPSGMKSMISRNLRILNSLHPNNKLSAAIQDLLKIDASVPSKTSLQEANLLFRNKNFGRALETYLEVYESNEFYEFLRFNIYLCRKKLNHS